MVDVTIYSPDGEKTVCNHLNARELIKYSGYTYNSDPTTQVVTEKIEDPETVVELELENISSTLVEETEEVVTPESSLDKIAATVFGIGTDKYLEEQTTEFLRELAESRYGFKVPPRIKRETLIDKIKELEYNKNN